LTGAKREKANSILAAHQASMRKLNERGRAELLRQMREVLGAEPYQQLREELERRPLKKG
jgi:hypothetical protein